MSLQLRKNNLLYDTKQSMFKRISLTLQQYPKVIKAAFSGSLFCLSDTITQLAIERKEFDWKRNMQFLVLGLGWLGPCIELWYSHFLPKISARYLSHMGKTRFILARLAIDTVVFAPVSYLGFYFFKDIIWRTDSTPFDIQTELKNKFVPTLLADWAIWTPANLVNFCLVPMHWQSIYVGFFSFFFNIILSYIANLEIQDIEKHKKQEQLGIARSEGKQSRTEQLLHKVHPSKIQIIV